VRGLLYRYRYPAKAYDPWAVYSATRSRQDAGLKGSEGLTEIQKRIYEFTKEKGKVIREEILANFKMEETELQIHLATLRHCELLKGRKEGNKVHLVLFDYAE